MKVWITKYALTTGIIVRTNAEVCTGVSDDMIKCNRHEHFHGEGRDWHRTREGAKARAEQMRVKKIASLKKQIEKLEKKEDFTVV